jgi:hypothetical protein
VILGRDRGNADGFEFWMVKYTRGEWNLRTMATFFSQSPEFEASYGALTQDGFIRQVYRNVLGREGEQGGVTFWNGQMSAGMTRGTLLLRFSESPENIATSGTSQPTLGEFNAGRVAPWTCIGWTPPNPGDAVNCRDFANGAEAQAWFDYYYPAYGDIARLDFDNNLIACDDDFAGIWTTPDTDNFADVALTIEPLGAGVYSYSERIGQGAFCGGLSTWVDTAATVVDGVLNFDLVLTSCADGSQDVGTVFPGRTLTPQPDGTLLYHTPLLVDPVTFRRVVT